MSTDRVTKVLLAAIAVALWINAINPWVQPKRAFADTDDITRYVKSIDSHVDGIYSGICLNSKIC